MLLLPFASASHRLAHFMVDRFTLYPITVINKMHKINADIVQNEMKSSILWTSRRYSVFEPLQRKRQYNFQFEIYELHDVPINEINLQTYSLYHKRQRPQLSLLYTMELMNESVPGRPYPTIVIARFDLLSTLFLTKNQCLWLPINEIEKTKLLNFYIAYSTNGS